MLLLLLELVPADGSAPPGAGTGQGRDGHEEDAAGVARCRRRGREERGGVSGDRG